MPTVFANILGKSVIDWIEDHTAGATFCRKFEEVKVYKGDKNL